MGGRNSRSVKAGSIGERVAELQLKALGFACVERIQTGFKILKWVNPKRRQAVVIPIDPKPSGDFKAVDPKTGRSVLVEVKQRDGRLRYSDLKAHQRQALTEHAEANGLSLVVWVADADVFVMAWPIDGFKPRTSLTADDARRLDFSSLDGL